jgi:arylformamidase
MAHDDKWYERQYMPSLSIPDAGNILARWIERANATRQKLTFQSDLRYGAHQREVMDFYPAAEPKGCLVFIHGGYWVEFSKFETSWVAESFVNQGLSVALINYPLCPEVSIADIRASCSKAFGYLYTSVLCAAERSAIVVTGHSAGGHLAAAHLMPDWTKFGLPRNPIAGIMPISGVFDVAPLVQTSLEPALKLSEASADSLNLIKDRPHNVAKLVVAVGQQESEEFHRQSDELTRSWAALKPDLVDVAGANHFTILDSLANTGAQLNQLAVAMARR